MSPCSWICRMSSGSQRPFTRRRYLPHDDPGKENRNFLLSRSSVTFGGARFWCFDVRAARKSPKEPAQHLLDLVCAGSYKAEMVGPG